MSRIIVEKDFSRHPLHYFTLLCTQLVGLWGIFWFSYNPLMQMSIIVAMAICFIAWGVVHHQEHRDLHIKVIMDYILYALLAVLIMGSLVLRS
jgi:hypothetical protein